MISFRKEINTPPTDLRISYKDRLFSAGSCFSENIGLKFRECKFNIHINPYGQQYNPVSISRGIERIIENKPYVPDELIHHNQLYHSFDHHGSFSGEHLEDVIRHINRTLQDAHDSLQKSAFIFITPGTATVFRYIEQDRIVNNCHKITSTHFKQVLLSADEVEKSIFDICKSIHRFNPTAQIIFTVSPVRYFALGEFENSVSKGRLHSAIYEAVKALPYVHYFPAYEFIIDDLRDYRFFKEDLIHPNNMAIRYVWEKLMGWMDEETKRFISMTSQIDQMLNHRVMNTGINSVKDFYSKLLKKIESAQTEYGISYEDEVKDIKKRAEEISGSNSRST